ncbi:hypothetical protein CAPN002_23420 [Capnocytophaga stomatis]|uniref:hypothetical protein n=1 Tax=Capnocytophaga stomatis TaxID=1848904 RepID=UPI00194F16FF|nr:hypothetical protein [Capnocytophaga stomatis]GIJ95124.1 hypothetical protein CAPN002_23420 [Capnocytophaga stomatis]
METNKKPRKKLFAFTKAQNRRRYRLHGQLKKIAELRIYSRKLEVKVPHDFEAESNKQLRELYDKFGYNIQYCIK